MIAFFATIPISISIPMSTGVVISSLVTRSAMIAPAIESGSESRTVRGCSTLPKSTTSKAYTKARPVRMASPNSSNRSAWRRSDHADGGYPDPLREAFGRDAQAHSQISPGKNLQLRPAQGGRCDDIRHLRHSPHLNCEIGRKICYFVDIRAGNDEVDGALPVLVGEPEAKIGNGRKIASHGQLELRLTQGSLAPGYVVDVQGGHANFLVSRRDLFAVDEHAVHLRPGAQAGGNPVGDCLRVFELRAGWELDRQDGTAGILRGQKTRSERGCCSHRQKEDPQSDSG